MTAIAAKLLHRQLKFQEELLNKALEMRRNLIGAQFTCFTGTKRHKTTQILTNCCTGDDFDSFSDTPNTDLLKCVLNLEIMSASTPVYLLYWYKSTNTNTDQLKCVLNLEIMSASTSVYLLYWHKRTNSNVLLRRRTTSTWTSYLVYLLYWYKSTNTDVLLRRRSTSTWTSCMCTTSSIQFT